jgi:hypothetical protein
LVVAQQYDPEHLYVAVQAEAQTVLGLHGRQAPPPLQGEAFTKYDRRLTDVVKQTSPKFRDVVLDAGSATYPILKREVYEDSRREAMATSDVPEGTLKEVRIIDQSWRSILEYYGSPRAWLKDFSTSKKYLVGVYAPAGDDRNFQKF